MDYPGPVREPLVDSFGRAIESVRISITDRCNFRCRYCMPAEGLPWLSRSEVLTYEEIERLTTVLCSLGVTSVRITGGEPLVRRDVPELIGRLAQVPGLDDLALTTNGVALRTLAGPLVQAGLRRINVSLDSLDHTRFKDLTRRDMLDRVLDGLAEAERFPELRPIKINCVAMRGITEREVLGFAELARSRPFVVRFIEFMPLDADQAWSPGDVLPGDEVRAMIDAAYPLVALPAPASSTAQRFAFADGTGEVGFINPVSQPFCSSCDRIRITADGLLRTCLFAMEETDLRTPLRDGASDDDLVAILRRAIQGKRMKHAIGEPGFVRTARSMSQIGG
jgi:cyclic pyranopterin phosphate synthase